MGVVLIIGGIAWYFAWSAFGSAMWVKKTGGYGTPRPGSGDVPAWVSVLAMAGIIPVVAGIINLLGG